MAAGATDQQRQTRHQDAVTMVSADEAANRPARRAPAGARKSRGRARQTGRQLRRGIGQITPTWDVVVADDWPDIRLLITTLLRRSERFNVVSEAANGAEAVDSARARQPDVLLLDLSMPIMDGIQALPLVKERSPETKVVILTGYTDEPLRAAALLAGADLYVDKEEMVQTLVPQLLELMGEKPGPR
jgi:CheY-like chemotaxis protein